jgi:chromosome segregation ATPase
MANETWYFVGDGVLGEGKKCVHKGEKILPSLKLTKERLQHFINCGKISDKPLPKHKDDKHLYGDCEEELAETKKALKAAEYAIKEKDQAIKELNERIEEAVAMIKREQKRYADLEKKYEDLKKKCKNK